MTSPRPRLALPRPPQHPLAVTVRSAGWEPVPFLFTRMELSHFPPPRSFSDLSATVILSPSGAQVAALQLPEGSLCLVQGRGTAEGLGRKDLQVVSPADADAGADARVGAESLWELLKARFPAGGDFLLVRGERSRGYLESAAGDSKWRLHPWITHREVAMAPLPPLPEVEAVLALGPFQAEILAPLAQSLRRFAWGETAAAAFAKAGSPAHAQCEPTSSALEIMLAQQLTQKEESPC